ncbi:MAG: 16S rRNA (cytosine(1402)-N(4))-methyltransferase RsmH [Proteobacteria bacterium]|nr:16S rRNA (cytosine(1402)-N(4))-methyltransferase RsmH [Pseudomonadota bacterium]
MPGTTITAREASQRHVPVMLNEVLAALSPAAGETYIDGTFGAGGYTRAILGAADCRVIGVDRDPAAIAGGAETVAAFGARLELVQGTFSDIEAISHGEPVSGVVLDIGVSSMQIDDPERGFSFLRDGPLDMRMSRSGPSAADVVNSMKTEALADLIYILGEEPRSRAIARAIDRERSVQPLATTLDLVRAVERATGPQRAKDRTHPATRTFQALRIHVNGELEQLAEALFAAERLLVEGGRLVVVTFHSLEDRIVKRFFASRSGHIASASRHLPAQGQADVPSFNLLFRGHQEPGAEEIERNPRARSAKLRAGVRTAAAALKPNLSLLGVPMLKGRVH